MGTHAGGELATPQPDGERSSDCGAGHPPSGGIAREPVDEPSLKALGNVHCRCSILLLLEDW